MKNIINRCVLFSLLACLFGGCNSPDAHKVPFDALSQFDDPGMANVMMHVEMVLSISLQQDVSDGIKASVRMRNKSKATIILRNWNDACELVVRDKDGRIVSFSTKQLHGLTNDATLKDVNETLNAAEYVRTDLVVAKIVSNAQEVSDNRRKRESIPVAPNYGPISSGSYTIYALCSLVAKTTDGAGFTSALFQSKYVEIVLR